MAIIIGPSVYPDSPARAVLEALQKLQPLVQAEDIQIIDQAGMPNFDPPAWRWVLCQGSPSVVDNQVTSYKFARQFPQGRHDRWVMTADLGHPALGGGIVVMDDHGWWVAACHASSSEDAAELAEQVVAHITFICGS